jgi:hypothetical protein
MQIFKKKEDNNQRLKKKPLIYEFFKAALFQSCVNNINTYKIISYLKE